MSEKETETIIIRLCMWICLWKQKDMRSILGWVCNCVVVNTDRQESENSGTGTAKVEVKFKFILDDSQIELKRREKNSYEEKMRRSFFTFKIEIWFLKLASFYSYNYKRVQSFVSDRYL